MSQKKLFGVHVPFLMNSKSTGISSLIYFLMSLKSTGISSLIYFLMSLKSTGISSLIYFLMSLKSTGISSLIYFLMSLKRSVLMRGPLLLGDALLHTQHTCYLKKTRWYIVNRATLQDVHHIHCRVACFLPSKNVCQPKLM